ncbi:hypothetical protein ACTHPF_27015 [Paenibacillus sp. SAF-054]|uniref:hypothetical protein n=1 Tax=unclassified Paenibacillus TaxID=185978 RepID=UPI003F7EF2FD
MDQTTTPPTSRVFGQHLGLTDEETEIIIAILNRDPDETASWLGEPAIPSYNLTNKEQMVWDKFRDVIRYITRRIK